MEDVRFDEVVREIGAGLRSRRQSLTLLLSALVTGAAMTPSDIEAKKKKKKKKKNKNKHKQGDKNKTPTTPPPSCKRTCGEKECGPDGCGGSCGACEFDDVCCDGRCTGHCCPAEMGGGGCYGGRCCPAYDPEYGASCCYEEEECCLADNECPAGKVCDFGCCLIGVRCAPEDGGGFCADGEHCCGELGDGQACCAADEDCCLEDSDCPPNHLCGYGCCEAVEFCSEEDGGGECYLPSRCCPAVRPEFGAACCDPGRDCCQHKSDCPTTNHECFGGCCFDLSFRSEQSTHDAAPRSARDQRRPHRDQRRRRR